MLSGTLVPSFEGANSRVTSISEKETGEVLTSAVFSGSVRPAATSNQAGGSRGTSDPGKEASHPPTRLIPARWKSARPESSQHSSHRGRTGAPGTARLTNQRHKAHSPPVPFAARRPRSPARFPPLCPTPACRETAADLAARRARARKEVKRIVTPEPGELHLIAELRDLLPGAVRAQQIMGKVSTVTIRDRSQDVLAVVDDSSLTSAMRGNSLPIE